MFKLQPSFTAGELSPSMYARVDLTKFHVGCRTLRNFISLAYGGVATRPGTLFVGEVGDSSKRHRLASFRFSTTQAYILVFGDKTMQVIKDRGFVMDGGSRVQITTPYSEADLPGLYFTQSADTLFIAHPSHPPRKLVRYSHTSWLLSAISFSPTVAPPDAPTVTATGLTIGDWTVRYVVSTIGSDGSESPISTDGSFSWNGTWTSGGKVAVTWPAVTGADSYIVYKNVNGFYGLVGSIPAAGENLSLISGLTGYTGGGATVSASSEYSGNPAWHAFDSSTSTAWQSTGDTGWLKVDFGAADTACTGYTLTANTLSGSLPYMPTAWIFEGYDGTSWHTIDSQSGLAWSYGQKRTFTFDEVNYRAYQLTVSATSGPSYRVNVPEMELLGDTPKSFTFVDTNITPSTADGPQIQNTPFSKADDYPGAVTIHSQRTVWGGTNNKPSTIWGSQAGSYANMNISSPLKADDSYEFTLDAKEVNRVNGLCSLRELILFTSGAVFKVSGDQDSAISAKSINVKAQSYWGSEGLPPIVTGESALFVEAGGRVIRDLVYSLEIDGYKGSELTVLSSHMFKNRRAVEWAHARDPYGIIWIVCDDGALRGLTYLREHDVVGLHRHETDGLFESVACIPGEQQDDVYFIVQRTVDGDTKRYVEVMPERIEDGDVEKAFCVDCGLIYSGAATSHLTGLGHLAGKDVAVYANGSVEPRCTVAEDGSIDLQRTCTYAVVGLPYTCDFESLDVDMDDSEGTSVGRLKTISSVTLKVEDARGFWAGTSFDQLDEARMLDEAFGDDPIPLFTGEKRLSPDGSYDTSARVCVRQIDPIPLTISAIVPEVFISEQRGPQSGGR